MSFAPTTDWRRLPPEAKQQFLELLQRKNASKIGAAFKRKYKDDPAGFVRDCFNWSVDESPADYQLEILSALVEHKRAAIRAPHGVGKTSIAAWVVLWFALTRDGEENEDWKVVCTASAWRQLKHFLFPEIHKWARRLRWSKILRSAFTGSELLQLNLKLSTGEAFAVASDDANLIEGAHADSLLYLFDESKSIPDAVFDAAEGALSSGDCYALSISTPGEPVGRFYKIHAQQPGLESWWTRHITLKEAIAAGRINAAWANDKKLLWGEQSAIFQNRVLGEFHTSDADGVIPLSWVEQANERWEEWKETGEWLPFTCVSADIARSTDGDKTVLALRHSHVITELRRFAVADTMISSGHVAAILNARGSYGIIDLIGVGAGVYDRLRELKLTVRPFNASASPPDKAKDRSGELEFLNMRAYAWWKFRELLDPAFGANVCLPPDDRLLGDLVAPHWKMTSGGKVQIESKDDIRKRLGRSTDDGDAVVMAFLPEIEKRKILYA
ncbi:MAG: hypothetical protein ABJA18_11975 [bacterium]